MIIYHLKLDFINKGATGSELIEDLENSVKSRKGYMQILSKYITGYNQTSVKLNAK